MWEMPTPPEDGLRVHAAALESVANGVVITNRDGLIEWVNPAFSRMTGYSLEEVVGRNPRILKSDVQDRDLYRDLWTTVLSGAVWRGDMVNRRKDGTLYCEEMTITPVRDERGEIVRFVAVKQDVTERKRLEDELRRLNATLEEQVSQRTAELHKTVGELEHFSYTITHDLRAPLRAMRGYAELALSSREEAKREEYLEKIATASGLMDRLIRDALDYSKALRGELPLEPVDADALLREVLHSYEAFQPPRLSVEIEGRLPEVVGNAAGLTQCFSNLLDNAAKFARPDGAPRVVVRAEAGDRIRLWFEDQGIGIPKDRQERIFELFHRLHSRADSTGIGLALVRKVVERMGGKVGVDSEEGRGSRFWLELPPAKRG